MKKQFLCYVVATALMFSSFSTISASASVSTKQNSNDSAVVSTVNGNRINKSIEVGGNSNATYTEKIEHGKKVLKELGYSDKELEAMGDKDISDTVNGTDKVSVTEEYIKIDANGNSVSMSKEDCLKAVDQLEKSKEVSSIKTFNDYNKLAFSNNLPYSIPSIAKTKLANGATNTVTSDNGYMKMLTLSTYISSGYYTLSATYTWLNMPDYRMIDAFSIAAPDCAWTQGASATASTFTYKAMNFAGAITNYSQTGSVSVQTTGIYATYDLPPTTVDYVNGNVFVVADMVFYIRGKARVSDYTNARAFNVYSRYEHTYSSLSFQPSFDWISLGISASTSIVNGSDLYTSYNLTNYTP